MFGYQVRDTPGRSSHTLLLSTLHKKSVEGALWADIVKHVGAKWCGLHDGSRWCM